MILNFQCPKCKEHTQAKMNRLRPGTELWCEHCEYGYQVDYRIIFDKDRRDGKRKKAELKAGNDAVKKTTGDNP